MIWLLKNIRKLIYLVNIGVALGIFLYFHTISTSLRIETIRLTQTYALYSTFLLYVALLASPLYTAFPYLSTKTLHVTTRKAIGNSAFFFALLHATIAFFLQLGGFQGLFYLTNNYLLSITLSFIALVILCFMMITSFSYFITRLGNRWKPLHRFVYLAVFFILIHALMLGTHFSNISGLIPQIFIYALTVLLMLEAFRFDKYLAIHTRFPRYILFVVGICITGIISYQLIFNPSEQSLSVHSKHTAGRAAASGRFSVNLLNTPVIQPGKPVTLRFQIYDNEAKKPLNDFAVSYEKIIHMIVVNNGLSYFAHIHPRKEGTEFSITTSFPKSDLYHAYFNYHPVGFREQVSDLDIQVGNSQPSVSNQKPDSSLTKSFTGYNVTLQSNAGFVAANMNASIEFLTFSIYDAKTKQPITDLSPYLGAFGHLVMINQKTLDYIHVHPNGLPPQSVDATSGPEVQFIPLAINKQITPGVYRLFAQFNHHGKLFVADYTIRIH